MPTVHVSLHGVSVNAISFPDSEKTIPALKGRPGVFTLDEKECRHLLRHGYKVNETGSVDIDGLAKEALQKVKRDKEQNSGVKEKVEK